MLNEAQQEVAQHSKGALLVIAGAGTGKTRTLVHRFVNLIEKGVHPDKILLLTFTRKAAQEMQERAEKLLKNRQLNAELKPNGGTFHAVAFKWLRKLNVISSGFSILDDNDLKKLIKMDLSKDEKSNLAQAGISLDNILQINGLMVNLQEKIESIISRYFPQAFNHLELIRQIINKLISRKATANLFDYDDILYKWLEILRTPHGEIIKNNYEFIMVDEYQDTSFIQLAILKELASKHQNLMAVGDDCQSIYSFRGALANQMNSFIADFTNAKVIKLQDNYRSTQAILDMCNDVISASTEVFPKKLKATNKFLGNPPQLIKKTTDVEVAYTLIQKIYDNLQQGISLSQQAVLFRSSIQVHTLERVLVKEKIPYIKFGGIKITEAAHLKDFISIISCPFANNTTAWLRTLEMIPGIGAVKAQQLFQDLQNDKMKIENLPTNSNERLTSLLTILNSKPTDQPQVEFIEIALKWYKIFLFENYENAHQRLHELENLCHELIHCQSLNEFAAEILLNKIELEVDIDNSLVLSTIHSAKGKEWECVYLVNVSDDAIPLRRSSADIEEERRLLYVAMTRAKEQLYLYQPNQEKFTSEPTKLSRFLKIAPPNNSTKTLNYQETSPDEDSPDDLIYVREDSGIF